MDRVSGWYKRKIQLNTAIIALLLAFVTNADTLRIATTLWHNPELRAEGVKLAEQRAEASKNAPEPEAANAPTVETTYPDASDPLNPKMQPVTQAERAFLSNLLGWESAPDFKNMESGKTKALLLMLLGWVLTGIAVSLGAPFWFDVLNKFINIRGAGKAPGELPKAPSTTPIPASAEKKA